jgi:hypothetical protein
MIATKIFVAIAIGFIYSFMSITTMITGTSAVVKRGIRGGVVAGAGTAVGLAIFSGVAITGLGLVQYFLRPVHLAIIEILLGVLFVATGFFFLLRRPRAAKKPKPQETNGQQKGLWIYFVTNLMLILSGPQKIAYIAGLFLLFGLHITDWGVKAVIPVAVLIGSLASRVLYSIAVARGGSKLANMESVRNGMHRLGQVGHLRVCVAVRRTWVKKHVARLLIQVVKVVLIVIGVVLVVKGALLFHLWGFEPWGADVVRG